VHSWQLSEGTRGYVLFFSQAFYLLGYPHKKLNQFPFFNPLLLKPLVLLPEPALQEATGLIRQIENEYQNQKWRKEDIIRNYLDILLIKLGRYYKSNQESNLTQAGSFYNLQQLEELIDQHFKAHEPVSFYAEKLHVSVKHLNELCKQALGKTTSELIQDRLVLEAQRLLIHSGLTITQVAAKLGFFDNSYFARFFKKHTRQTPEQFRQSAA
jgi:AraC family transcriptional regulator, transcriptional activator of pobA